MHTPYKAIIFDLDGTLLDTLADIADTMNAVLLGLGLPTHPRQAYKQFVGDGVAKCAERVLPADRRDAATIEFCKEAFLVRYANAWKKQTRPYPGIEELLRRCHTSQLRMGVCTNKPHEVAVETLHHFFAPDTFEHVQGVVDHLPRKPNPAMLRGLLGHFALNHTQVVYVGDTATDMRTAKGAACFSVGVTWGFRHEHELREQGADLIIHHPRELQHWLGI
ncbi:HAD family hydrolase [Acanthopleuribacter pedis]|uniref:phosphoglycolate phosphatase n=1 Tax=Acanthopleuribacter pedis TaxID=442870 RepID=A0A8J7QQY8_9BACT|nr:HAD-IA family hydrolase [Acanthopleuribacter pedis]MBO1322570.1 HAD-IA family hydrolase [Acanthopleuribacter pedis]